MNQEAVFSRGEGDAWFDRNRAVLAAEADWSADQVLQLLAHVKLAPSTVLEVGAANGYRLAGLCRRFGCRAIALEPSGLAIADGESRFPIVRFVRGEASDLRIFEDGAFDLVIVNFVLHWVDRRVLLRSVAEIDRVLQDEGHLVVGDFDPDGLERVKYHHLPDADVWTYKQDYPGLWLHSGLYEKAAALRFHHTASRVGADVESAHRGQVTVMRKTLRGLYRIKELP
jgi:ubiquinone/menaquinone biosynthesis C-methylase UbiE